MNTSRKQFAASVAAADRASQRVTVCDELNAFDASLAGKTANSRQPPMRALETAASGATVGSPVDARRATRGARMGAAASTQRLRARAPYQDSRSLLTDVLRVQKAAAWLALCPSETLRVLQRRVLCNAEALVVGYGGIPSYLRPYLWRLPFAETLKAVTASGAMEAGRYATPEEAEEELTRALAAPTPEPISLSDFLTIYLVADPSPAGGDGDILTESRVVQHLGRKRNARKTGKTVDGASGANPEEDEGEPTPTEEPLVTVSRTFQRSILLARPPQQTSAAALALAAGTQDLRGVESTLMYTSDVPLSAEDLSAHLSPSATGSSEIDASILRAIQQAEDAMREADAPLRAAEGVQLGLWTNFFTEHFDPLRSGLCDDSVSLLCAILLACGMRGAAEADSSAEVTADRAVADLRARRERTVPNYMTANAPRAKTCTACECRCDAADAVCRHTTYMRTAAARTQDAAATDGGHDTGTRFFLGTAAIVLWAQAFLTQHRAQETATRQGLSNTDTEAFLGDSSHGGDATAGDELPPGEVFLLRDWIAQQAQREKVCVQRQAPSASAADMKTLGKGAHRAPRGAGVLQLTKTCATNSPTLDVALTQEKIDATVGALTEWAQRSIEEHYPLTAQALVRLLREMLPVSAYYATFFC